LINDIANEYIRDILHREEEYEVVLITWPPGSRSRKHNHGNSCGLTRVLEGKIYEERDGKRSQHEKGSVIVETPDTIHVVGNDSAQEARSLHFYTPKLDMKFYD